MEFEFPEIIKVPEIENIYRINDKQYEEIKTAADQLDDNIFLDDMDSETCTRWETILGLEHLEDDTIDERRFRVQNRVFESLPYTKNTVRRQLDTTAPEGYEMEVDGITVTVKVALKSKRMLEDIEHMMEEIVPLNMLLNVYMLYNNWKIFETKTWESLEAGTWENMRSEVQDE